MDRFTFTFECGQSETDVVVDVASDPETPPPPFLFKVLATSGLEDYFYLNLVDWSSKNVAAHGLGHFLLHNAAV